MNDKQKKNNQDSSEVEAKQRIRIKIKSFDHKIIDKAAKMIIDTAKRTNAEIKGPVPLPTEISKFTVNRSTFVHKEARDQFAMRVHQRLIDIYEPKAKTISDLMSLALPGGVDIEIKM
ncbi:30S ribosomal protein S10 [Candidatus Kuenenbacteria bacterium CG11_big_fil_rev_8_21_14_0_20_37_9]|uniref:Small ribosomal subunit protein uS10 n=2 Tax=Candidatus Kueneniibacteriota TaxID=1752740 RepID=A0A2M6XRR1_9BACT|nr:MAG: 30S ribosomal protein S10 [Candidatus Kuenenbacteria bacterium CG1_02_38_13]PIR05807.1 MAG: 30S ribosomal protein S10 [Candidatus Kuenenbacteria bacterium CG11_big_fil_rev_8_21_14_0_20_37_9]PIU10310.1 MAG: 30S ribosomal protein S10 [Candidatus Kuenenbacteria bacterium CG08_land_8_20_14_0_20_37_23]